MPNNDISTFTELLQSPSFAEIKNKIQASRILNQLSDHYENLYEVIYSLLNLPEEWELNDNMLYIIADFLDREKDSFDPHDDLLFAVFSPLNLKKIKQMYERLNFLIADEEKYYALLKALILYDLKDIFFTDEPLESLSHLAISFFSSKEAVNFVNVLDPFSPSFNDSIYIYNDLLARTTQGPDFLTELKKILLENNLDNWNKILDRMRKLKINIARFDRYTPILHLHHSWFNPDHKNRLQIINEKLLSPEGIEYVLNHLKLSHLSVEEINLINELVAINIDRVTDAPSWQSLEKSFIHEPSQLEKLFKRFQVILTHIDNLEYKKMLTNDPVLILTLDEYCFAPHTIQTIGLLLNLQTISNTKSALIQRILKAHVEIDDDYVNLLNQIIIKPQLEYPRTLCELSDAWLSKQGLEKLNKFSEKYLTPFGLKLINQLSIEIDDKQIAEINSIDHTSLSIYLDSQKIKSEDTRDLIHLHVSRSIKIDQYIASLKMGQPQNFTDQPINRRRANTNALLKSQCPLTLCIPISQHEEDAIIHIKPHRTQPLSLEELQANLLLILLPKGDHDDICCKKDVLNCVGKKYKEKSLSASDIAQLSDKNIDLDYLNHQLGLTILKNAPQEQAVSSYIEHLIQLKQEDILTQIPDFFFQDNHIELLAILNQHFLNNPLLFTYLKQNIKDNISHEDILTLNSLTQELINFVKKATHPAEILEKIPLACLSQDILKIFSKISSSSDKNQYLNIQTIPNDFIDQSYFQKLIYLDGDYPPFDIDFFLKTPLAWFKDRSLLSSLIIISNLPSSDIHTIVQHGLLDFALQSVEQALLLLNKGLGNFLSSQELVQILDHYIDEQNFFRLLKLAEKNISIEIVTLLNSKNLLSLRQKIYTFACESRPPQAKINCPFLSDSVYFVLRFLIRNDLLYANSPRVNNFFQTLEKEHQKCLNEFKENLADFEKKYFINKNGYLVPKNPFYKAPHLKACQALNNTLKTTQNYGAIANTIKEQQNEIKANDIFSFKSTLELITNQYLTGVKSIYRSLSDSTLSSYGAFLRACLLSDHFYVFLIQEKRLDRFICDFPNILFPILKTYRPNAFAILLVNHDFFRDRYGLYIKSEHDRRKHIEKNMSENTSEQNSSPVSKIFTPTILKRYPKQIPCPSGYQLQDLDINVGMASLNQVAIQKNILFIPLGPIEVENINFRILYIIQKITVENNEKLCAGIFNINKNHFFLCVAYTPINGLTQIMVLNPAFIDREKKHTSKKIKKLLEQQFNHQCKYVEIDVIQQFNYSDCGIACLQTLSDIINANAITISQGNLIFNREKLTLNAYDFLDNEDKFVEQTIMVRKKWEDLLDQQNEWYILYPTGEKESAGSYSLKYNKRMQELKSTCQKLFGNMLEEFTKECGQQVYNYFLVHNDIPYIMPAELTNIIDPFVKKGQWDEKYLVIFNEIQTIEVKFPSEIIKLNLHSVADKLLEHIQLIYRDQQYEIITEDFLEHLRTHNLTDPTMLENVYQDFINANEVFLFKVQFFDSKNWNYFNYVSPLAEKYLRELKVSKLFLLNEHHIEQHFFFSTKKTTPTAHRADQLKNKLVETLNEIIELTKTYEEQPYLLNFLKPFSYREYVANLTIDCIRWKNWIKSERNIILLQRQWLFIIECLTNVSSNVSSNPKSISNLIRPVLAHLIEIPEEKIEKFNNNEMHIIADEKIDVNSLYSLYDDIQTEIMGYEKLQKLVEAEVDRLKSRIYPFDYTLFGEPHLNLNVQLPEL